MGPKLVFCGPTLQQADRAALSDLVFLPPAAQGDLIKAAQEFRPDAILLIDGVFQSEPAIRHKEILWVISKGIAVLGASSMGALRAAELYPRMQGVGLIYRWYRRHDLAPDDAVAVLHGPAEFDFAPLTLALIDMRRTIAKAQRGVLVSAPEEAALERSAIEMNFRERTLEQVALHAFPQLSGAERQGYLAILRQSLVQQKRRDALRAIDVLRSHSYVLPPPSTVFEITRAFEQDVYDAGLNLDF